MSVSRLLIPALCLWLSALACELITTSDAFDGEQFVRLALALAVVTLTLAAFAGWRVRPWRSSRILAVAVSTAIGALAAAIHLLPMLVDPLKTLTSENSSVVVTGVVQSQGRLVVSERSRLWQLKPEYAFQLASSTLSAGGHSWQVELPMQVISLQVPPSIGSHVRLRGAISPGELPVTSAFVRARGEIAVVSGPGFVDLVANDLRSGLLAAVSDRPADAASLVAGLSIGDQSLQTPELGQAMRTAGLSHLTAVSGGNVAVIIALVMALARWCRLRLSLQVLCCLVALAWFVVLVRPQPSVLRASVMGAVVLVGLLTGGQRRGTGVLASCIALLIVLAPELAVSWAFALSVAATGGLILWSPTMLHWLQARLPSWPPPVLEGLAVTLTAQLATVPIIIAMGSTVGLAGIPANLLAMPVVPIITVLGLLTAALGVVVPPLAVFTGLIASWFASWIASLAFAMSALPFATVPWPPGALGAALALGLLAAVLFTRRFLRRRFPCGSPWSLRIALIAIGLMLALLLPWLASPRGWPMTHWSFVACDVGQGDALVIRTGQHSAMLIDAGLDDRDVDLCLQRLGVTTLDVILLTHFHADHVGGLSGALRGRTIGAAFATPTKDPQDEARLVTRELADLGVTLQDVHAGDTHRVGSVSWQVLWPSRFISAGSIPNNASVVVLVVVDGLRILLPGDIEPEAQSALMAQHPGMHADIAKLPHHGSRFQDPDFAQWAEARLAVVSAGLGNDYGHPSITAVQQWQATGAKVWRTDLQGSIAVGKEPDGSLGVVAFKN